MKSVLALLSFVVAYTLAHGEKIAAPIEQRAPMSFTILQSTCEQAALQRMPVNLDLIGLEELCVHRVPQLKFLKNLD
jgi:hypothetical protein